MITLGASAINAIDLSFDDTSSSDVRLILQSNSQNRLF